MKNLIYNTSKRLLFFVALFQLAVSQVHISMITKLFVSNVGFYFFIFILSGLMIMFNLSSMQAGSTQHMGALAVSLVGALGSGYIYLTKTWADYLTQQSVTLDIIRASMIIITIGMVVYLVGVVCVMFTHLSREE